MRKIFVPLLVLAAVAACGFADDFTIAVIPKSGAQQYWKAIHAGAVKAQRELLPEGTNIKLLWRVPSQEGDREAQIKEVEAAEKQHVSGIVLAPIDSKALVHPVETAIDADIHVVAIDSSLESNAILSFVATNEYESGKKAAVALGESLSGKGNVMMLRYLERCASTEARELGFLDGLREHYPEIKVVSSDVHSGITRDLASNASVNLVKRFGEEIQGVFTSAGTTTAAMNSALKEADLAKKVKHIGCDAGVELLTALREGTIHALVVQDPFQIGYLAVKTLTHHLMGKGHVDKKIDTPAHLVTRENLENDAIAAVLQPPLDEYLRADAE